jgi:hypothetical protein
MVPASNCSNFKTKTLASDLATPSEDEVLSYHQGEREPGIRVAYLSCFQKGQKHMMKTLQEILAGGGIEFRTWFLIVSLQIQSDSTFHVTLAALEDAKKRLEDNFGWDLGTRLCDYRMIRNIGENVKADAEVHRVR